MFINYTGHHESVGEVLCSEEPSALSVELDPIELVLESVAE